MSKCTGRPRGRPKGSKNSRKIVRVHKTRERSFRELLEHLPPIGVVGFNLAGDIVHGRCGLELAFLGWGTCLAESEMQFYCRCCLEHVYVTGDMLGRMGTRP